MTSWKNISLNAETEDIKNAVEQINKFYRCIHCKKAFTISNSLGCLECFQHPGTLEIKIDKNGESRNQWSCCKKWQPNIPYNNNYQLYSLYNTNIATPPFQPPTEIQGCQKADHNMSSNPYKEDDNIQNIIHIAGIIPALNSVKHLENRPGFGPTGKIERFQI